MHLYSNSHYIFITDEIKCYQNAYCTYRHKLISYLICMVAHYMHTIRIYSIYNTVHGKIWARENFGEPYR